MKLKIPPPLIAMSTGFLMWLIAQTPLAVLLSSPMTRVMAGVFALIGVAVMVSAIVQFRRHDTTVDPMDPGLASHLVRVGVYRYTRNPMYLAMLLILMGWGFYLASVTAMVFPLFFVGFMNLFQISREEAALKTLFGDEYRTYCKQVPRWLGRSEDK